MKYQKVEKQLEKRLGAFREITRIRKGFSEEEKYMVKTASDTYLLRISPVNAHSRKVEEFEIMKEVFAKGVSCNRPIDMFTVEDEDERICSLFSFLPGYDAEENINALDEQTQYEIGFQAGLDLRKINSVKNQTSSWKQRKLVKHEHYLRQYFDHGYSFKNDKKVINFIELNCDRIESGPDMLQHDDFHLGNIVINNNEYSGILDFNRYDWGDPLHEFVKLEWFTWPISRSFSRGEIKGYFGKNSVSQDACLIISVYVAMSIFSTFVWTMKFHPHTMPVIEKTMNSILDSYEYFDKPQPEWTI